MDELSKQVAEKIEKFDLKLEQMDEKLNSGLSDLQNRLEEIVVEMAENSTSELSILQTQVNPSFSTKCILNNLLHRCKN